LRNTTRSSTLKKRALKEISINNVKPRFLPTVLRRAEEKPETISYETSSDAKSLRRCIEKLRKVAGFRAREKKLSRARFRRFVKRSETHPVPRSVRVIATYPSRVRNRTEAGNLDNFSINFLNF